jgi:tricorn protease-like protein
MVELDIKIKEKQFEKLNVSFTEEEIKGLNKSELLRFDFPSHGTHKEFLSKEKVTSMLERFGVEQKKKGVRKGVFIGMGLFMIIKIIIEVINLGIL